MEIAPYIIGALILGLPGIAGLVSFINFIIEGSRIERFRPQFNNQLERIDECIEVIQSSKDYATDGSWLAIRNAREVKQKIAWISISSSYDDSEEGIQRRYDERELLLDKFIKSNHKHLKAYYREERLKELLDERTEGQEV